MDTTSNIRAVAEAKKEHRAAIISTGNITLRALPMFGLGVLPSKVTCTNSSNPVVVVWNSASETSRPPQTSRKTVLTFLSSRQSRYERQNQPSSCLQTDGKFKRHLRRIKLVNVSVTARMLGAARHTLDGRYRIWQQEKASERRTQHACHHHGLARLLDNHVKVTTSLIYERPAHGITKYMPA